MLNHIILVGRIHKIDNNLIILKVFKHYKNDVGEYDCMYIKILLSENIGNMGKEYCLINEIIAINGYLDMNNNELIVKAKQITFLKEDKERNDYNE